MDRPRTDSGAPDAGAGADCARALDCDDGSYCNGDELCRPGADGADTRGCIPGPPPCMSTQTCDEAGALCRSECAAEPDADGDGFDATSCGGSDCDDSDGARYPGNREICDADDRDEDCDPTTFGVRDGDDDGFPDARCCNTDGSERRCGNDCDDTLGAAHPGLAESCDGFDNDCDATTDEDVQRAFYPDLDGDGYGDAAASPTLGCTPPSTSYVENATDCDDGEVRANTGTSEVCDEIDNDCDGDTDEQGASEFHRDADGDGFGDPVTVISSSSCIVPEGYSANGDDCDDLDADKHPGAADPCNRVDDDCSLTGAARGGVDEAEDLDDDGHAPIGGGACAGGPRPADDCSDADGTSYPGALERCDGLDNDCDGTEDDGATSWCGPAQTCGAGRCEGIRDLAAAQEFSCVVRAGEVFCWGAGDEGQLGDGALTNASLPRRVSGLTEVVEVAAGATHACARQASGAVWCWGANWGGQLGDGTTDPRNTPVRVSGLDDAVALSAGQHHTCASTTAGQLRCWGDNGAGQLGDGTTESRSTPTPVPGLAGVVQHDGGFWHTCARLADGSLACWGANGRGEIGDGTQVPRHAPVPIALPGERATMVAAGASHTCAVAASGRVFCWGRELDMVEGPSDWANEPREILGISTAREIRIGIEHACVRLASGGVQCWGDGHSGRLGDPAQSASFMFPVSVQDLSDAAALALGDEHGCARRSDASIVCWGAGHEGQLGDGGDRTPREVLVSGATALSRGGQSSVCALTSAGAVSCWGSNADEQLPIPLPPLYLRSPTEMASLAGADAVELGAGNGCALFDGAVRCWGSNDFGQLGDGTLTRRSSPGPVIGLGPGSSAQIAVGLSFTCARHPDGAVSCWGSGTGGALGDGAMSDSSVPVAVSGLTDATVIAAGDSFACAVRETGEVVFWGFDSVTFGVAAVPEAVGTLSTAVSVAAGREHALVLMADGSVYCIGASGEGQCPSATPRSSPVQVPMGGVTDALSISTAPGTSCVKRASGGIACWGFNTGDGTDMVATLPTAPLGITDATEINVLEGTVCALSTSRGVLCWGSDHLGQLGLGTLRVVGPFP